MSKTLSHKNIETDSSQKEIEYSHTRRKRTIAIYKSKIKVKVECIIFKSYSDNHIKALVFYVCVYAYIFDFRYALIIFSLSKERNCDLLLILF